MPPRIHIPRLRRMPALRLSLGVANPGVFAQDPLEGMRQQLEARAMVAAELIRGAWADLAKQEGVHRTGAYIAGIRANGRIDLVSSRKGDNLPVVEVVVDITNTAPHAHLVEVGHAAFSLPDKVNWGNNKGSIKRSKDGVPYLHIPFRHFAYASPSERMKHGHQPHVIAAMMPESIYKQSKGLARTIPMRAGPVYSQAGQFLARDAYSVQGRAGQPSRLQHVADIGSRMTLSSRLADQHHIVDVRRGATAVSPGLSNPAWQGSKFSGMIKSGPERHTTYLTIRTLTPFSAGFRIPAVPGKYIVARLAKSIVSGMLKPIILDILTGKSRARAA